jgi:signal transduction histidine kinase
LPWAVYLVSVVLVLDVLGYMTWHMLRLERDDLEAAAASDLQERVRLALWRMDSLMAPIIAQESARPYFHYRSYYPAERAYTRLWEEVELGDVVVASPLLLASKSSSTSGALIRLHFQIEPGDVITSPQVPVGNLLDLAESSRFGMAAQVARSRELLDRVRVLVAASPALAGGLPTIDAHAAARPQDSDDAGVAFDLPLRSLGLSQQRAEGADAKSPPPESARREPEGSVQVGSFRPVWTSGPAGSPPELLFIRPVSLNGVPFRQGMWVDWPMLRRLLLSYVRDLLPDARLEPLTGNPSTSETTSMLASLPARLDPGAMPPLAPIGFSWTRRVLVVTWLAVLAGVIAIGLVLRASIRLGDRRGRFVSAVTHELRTPLTTFCLYTEMLADGVVRDEPTRASYLETLKAESRRLAGIVENVLAYARLGRPRPATRPTVTGAQLADALEPVVRRRAAAANAQLHFEVAPDAAALTVAADAESVERIVMNLVENACKYGRRPGDEPRIDIRLAPARAGLAVTVADRGPGIPPPDAARVFSAFHRGAEHGSHAQPGIGLGLALARGLARELGGDLVLAPSDTGARFVLTLRRA